MFSVYLSLSLSSPSKDEPPTNSASPAATSALRKDNSPSPNKPTTPDHSPNQNPAPLPDTSSPSSTTQPTTTVNPPPLPAAASHNKQPSTRGNERRKWGTHDNTINYFTAPGRGTTLTTGNLESPGPLQTSKSKASRRSSDPATTPPGRQDRLLLHQASAYMAPEYSHTRLITVEKMADQPGNPRSYDDQRHCQHPVRRLDEFLPKPSWRVTRSARLGKCWTTTFEPAPKCWPLEDGAQDPEMEDLKQSITRLERLRPCTASTP
ncbi:hypothetical protein ACJZ2D_012115 [Fusarium nematophilum]